MIGPQNMKPKKTTPMRHVIYARKSSKNEEKQVVSIESLTQELVRTVYNQMLRERIKKGIANSILCRKVDRIGHNQ